MAIVSSIDQSLVILTGSVVERSVEINPDFSIETAFYPSDWIGFAGLPFRTRFGISDCHRAGFRDVFVLIRNRWLRSD